MSDAPRLQLAPTSKPIVCPSCAQPLRHPKVFTACGHSICESCEAETEPTKGRHGGVGKKSLRCKVCLEVTELNASATLPVNYALNDFVNKKPENRIFRSFRCSGCSKRKSRKETLFCGQCGVFSCAMCALDGHKYHRKLRFATSTDRDQEETGNEEEPLSQEQIGLERLDQGQEQLSQEQLNQDKLSQEQTGNEEELLKQEQINQDLGQLQLEDELNQDVSESGVLKTGFNNTKIDDSLVEALEEEAEPLTFSEDLLNEEKTEENHNLDCPEPEEPDESVEQHPIQVECPICLDPFTRKPKVLSKCGHTVCSSCEKSLTISNQDRTKSLTCPMCRTKTKMGKNIELPFNFALIEVIGNKGLVRGAYCGLCKERFCRTETMHCGECQTLLCAPCVFRAHRSHKTVKKTALIDRENAFFQSCVKEVLKQKFMTIEALEESKLKVERAHNQSPMEFNEWQTRVLESLLSFEAVRFPNTPTNSLQ